MFNGGCEILQPTSIQTIENNTRAKHDAYVKIIEQPAPKALRFRYLCEGRSAGSIPGISSTPENKTFPAIQVVGYQGRAVVVVSCVTKDQPYRPHPHNLVGREGCKRGVCTLEIPTETMSIQFCNLGIQCVKKKEIETALRLREEIRVDPFRTGFNHRNQPTSIDLNSVRLCFQVFLEGEKKGKFTVPLPPVVSEPVYDKKTASDLVIVKLSHCVSAADGDRPEIIMLCEKITKEDIQIRFYEERDGMLIWEDFGEFQPAQVHKQVAICFKPPRYHNSEISDPTKVFIQLRRPSDGATSEPIPFQFLPILPVIDKKRKRAKLDSLLNLTNEMALGGNSPFLNIKMEPRECSFPWTQGTVNLMPMNANVPSLPTAGALPPMSWNLPYSPNIQGAQISQPTPTNLMDSGALRSLLDLDSHTEFKQISLNSGELGPYEPTLDVTNLSDTLNTNLSLTDIQVGDDQNMTDSLTRLANNTIDRICQGTNNFK